MKLIILLLILYIISILLVQTFKHTDIYTAKKIIKNFIKECFSNQETTPYTKYPVFIGIDELGYPNSNTIEKEFKELNNVFENVVFCKFQSCNSNIYYRFKVKNPVKEMSEYDLIKYTEATCETILFKFIHKNYPHAGHIENMIFVQLQGEFLIVSIAQDIIGVKNNAQKKFEQYQNYKQSNNNTAEIDERWNKK